MNTWQVRIAPPTTRREPERMIYTVGNDTGIQVVTVPGADALSFTAHDDWCGDSETGFGATVSYQLHTDEVRKLHASIGAWLARKETP